MRVVYIYIFFMCTTVQDRNFCCFGDAKMHIYFCKKLMWVLSALINYLSINFYKKLQKQLTTTSAAIRSSLTQSFSYVTENCVAIIKLKKWIISILTIHPLALQTLLIIIPTRIKKRVPLSHMWVCPVLSLSV